MNKFVTLEEYKLAHEQVEELISVELIDLENVEYYEVWVITDEGEEIFYLIHKDEVEEEVYDSTLTGLTYLMSYH